MARTPTIPIIRHLARSGGTIISRCLGCMDPVVLLSEVHPKNMQVTRPAAQAREWFGLINDADVRRWKRTPPSMLQFVSTCEMRAKAQGKRLVLRDWTHLDYIGVPYAMPEMGFGLAESLSGAYEIAEAITVRHPIDQFVSLAKMDIMRGTLKPDAYLRGCAAFAEHAANIGFVRYEDFTNDPEPALRSVCERLTIPYDPTWRDRWASYTTITGDRPGTGSRGSASREIRPMVRVDAPAELVELFRANPDYARSCELLGYEL